MKNILTTFILLISLIACNNETTINADISHDQWNLNEREGE